MATKSKIVETSFRWGAGRYIQEDGAARLVGAETLRLKAQKPFILGGKTAFSKARDKIEQGLKENGLEGVFYTYEGFCNKDHCNSILENELGDCDVIVGVGGGNVCDAA